MFFKADMNSWLCAGFAVPGLLYIFFRAAITVRRNNAQRRELHLQMMRDARLRVKCGYDIRHSGRFCSECGWPVEKAG